MNEKECLTATADGVSAQDVLLEKLPCASRKWNRLCDQLRTFLSDVQEEFPDANYYTASGGFNLLLGRSHDDRQHPQQQLLALRGHGVCIGDGDW